MFLRFGGGGVEGWCVGRPQFDTVFFDGLAFGQFEGSLVLQPTRVMVIVGTVVINGCINEILRTCAGDLNLARVYRLLKVFCFGRDRYGRTCNFGQ